MTLQCYSITLRKFNASTLKEYLMTMPKIHDQDTTATSQAPVDIL